LRSCDELEGAQVNRLSAEDLLALRRDLDDRGYSVVKDVVAKDQLAEFNANLLEAYDQAAKFKGGGSISGHLNCFPGEGARFIYDRIEECGLGEAIRGMREGLPNHVRATASAPTEDPFSTNDGKVVFYQNWYSNASRLGVLREQIEVAAPITRSIPRFAKSLVGNRGYASY
jgi:hypothetical protein